MIATRLTLSIIILVAAGCTTTATPKASAPTQSRFGVHHAQSVWADPRLLTGDHLPMVMGHAADAGARWMRVNVPWGAVQVTDDRLDWSLTDALVERSRTANLELMVNVRGYLPGQLPGVPPGIPREPHQAGGEAKLRAYESFVRTMVARYRGKVRFWQIENEVTASPFWRGTVDEYVTILRAAYRAIHETDPDAKVLLQGFPSGPLELSEISDPRDPRQRLQSWAREQLSAYRVLLQRSLDSFDVLDLHLYENPETIPERVGWFRERLRELGRERPIWVTETGGPDLRLLHGDPRYAGASPGPLDHSTDVVKRLVLAFAAGAERVSWHSLWVPQGATDESAVMALVRGAERTAGFDAYATASRKLAKFTSVRRLDTGIGVFAYRFVGGPGDVDVVWANSPTQVRPDGRGPVLITDLAGRTTSTDGGVSVGARPVFVETAPR